MAHEANTTVFLLWSHDDYVEVTGSRYEKELEGVFSSLEALNKHCSDRWFDFQFDPRPCLPIRPGVPAEHKGKHSNLILWVQPTTLDQGVQ